MEILTHDDPGAHFLVLVDQRLFDSPEESYRQLRRALGIPKLIAADCPDSELGVLLQELAAPHGELCRVADLNEQLMLRLPRLIERFREPGATRTDPLAGLATRDTLPDVLQRKATVASHHDPVSLLLIDIDNFKKINDMCSNQAGDILLRRLAKWRNTAPSA